MSSSHKRCALKAFAVIAAVFFFSAYRAEAGWLYLLNDSDAGSRIYGFSVDEATGALTPLTGFPIVPGNGGINSIVSERMIADTANNRIYVINDSSDTVSAYTVDPASGALTAMPFSPITLTSGPWNTIAVHPSGSPIVVSDNSLNGDALSFVITDKTATPAMGNPFPVTGAAGFSSEFSLDGNYLYVGGNSGAGIAGFSVDAVTGILTPLTGSPFPSGGTASLAYAVDSAGRLFAFDNAFNIRAFTSASGVLSPVTGNPFPSGMTQRRFGLMHPNGNFYIVAGNTGNNVGVFQVSGSGPDTTVAAVTGSPFATGGTTANVAAITQSGNFLYIGNRISRNVTTFSVNSSTGFLTSLGVQPSNTLGTTGAINGIAYLPPPAVANAPLGGRVTQASGRGIGMVRIRLVSGDGLINLERRTNPFGFYNFAGLPTGMSYTITPSEKRYTFTPPNIIRSHTGAASDVNFTGQIDQ